MKKFLSAAFTLGLLVSTPELAQAYPLNPWGSMTSTGSLVLNPFLYLYPNGGGAYPILYAGYGVNEKIDVMAGVGYGFSDAGSGLGTIEIFPRYFINESMAITPHIYYTPSLDTLQIAPELHGTWRQDKMALTYNVGIKPTFISDLGMVGTTTFALIAPEYYFSERCSAFLEIDPLLARTRYTEPLTGDKSVISQGGVTFAPGVYAALDKEGKHTVAGAVQFTKYQNVDGVVTSVGLWYATSFAVK